MRNTAVFVLGLVLLFMGAGAGGQDPSPAKTDLAKEADAWAYPDSKQISSGGAGGRLHQMVLTTPDGIEAVLKHYDKKCGSALAGECPPGVFDVGTKAVGEKTVSTLSADDSTIPVPTRTKGSPRGITLRQVTQDEPGFLVTVLVTRTANDTNTHLLITYLKK